MKDTYILAIESSCDETSCSIVKNGAYEISNIVLSQIDVHTLYGGVVPEIASRMHIEVITKVIEEALFKSTLTMNDIDAIAVTYGPGLIGSLLVGVTAAKTLAYVYNKPLVPVHHIAGHIYANNLVSPMEFPLMALVVSGGHTELVYMKEDYNFEVIGSTLDDAVGECYDKVARILGMPYPGGPNVEKLAKIGKPTYHMPKILDDGSFNFSFSGIKSHVNNLVHNANQRGVEVVREDIACSFQMCVTDALVNKSLSALKKYNVKNFSIAGGVASNSYIRESLVNMCNSNGVKVFIPDKKYCTDNATMIGAAAYVLYEHNKFSDLTVNANSHEELSLEEI